MKEQLHILHLEDDPLDSELAQEVLRELRTEEERLPTISGIQRAVAEFYNVRVDDMRSRGRNKSIVLPRQVAMYLTRKLTQGSLSDIGESFGGRDHGTVLHACRLVESLMEQDTALILYVF